MNPLQRWRTRKPRRPPRSPLLPPRRSPKRRLLELHCLKPAWSKVGILLRVYYSQRVVVVADALVFLLTGAEAEGSGIPAAVPMQNLIPQVPEAAEGAPEPMEEAAEEAAMATGGEEATVPPEAALEVVVRSPEIQDAEPIRSAPRS
jgi:hypothetical protein